MANRAPTPADLERLLNQGDLDGAVRTADAMLAQSRRNFAAWLGRGCANLNRGRLVEADADLDAALKLAPDNASVLDTAGWVRFRAGQDLENA